LSAVVLFLFLMGCTDVHHESIDQGFPGLRDAMDANSIVCLLFVHGIGGYSGWPPQKDPQPLMDAICSELKLKAMGDARPVTAPGEMGSITRQDYVGENNRQLRVYILNWEGITQGLENEYLGYDNESCVTSTRLRQMNDARQTYFNNRAADAIIYAGTYKPVIQDAVRDALICMHRDLKSDTSGDYAYFFVTWSLGSKVLFDCLDIPTLNASSAGTRPGAGQHRKAFADIAQHTYCFFMLANQLPLLSLTEVVPGKEGEAATRPAGYDTMIRFAALRYQKVKTPLYVVAVSDPNDFLSYPISPLARELVKNVIFSNVSINVERTAWYIPFFKGGGLWVDPLSAHTGYGKDPEVIRLIIDGGKATKTN
jgi:hypothetical protein